MNALEALGHAAALLVCEWHEAGAIKPDYQAGIVQRFDDFRYTEQGVEYAGLRGDDVRLPNWERASVSAFAAIDSTEVMRVAAEHLRPHFHDEQDLDGALMGFVREIALDTLQLLAPSVATGPLSTGEAAASGDNAPVNVATIADDVSRRLTTQFIDELFDPSPRSWAEAEVQGIVVQHPAPELELGDGVRAMLRPITREELEGPTPVNRLHGAVRIIARRPSAVLRVEHPFKTGVGDQELIHRLIWALRLYRLGGVIAPDVHYGVDRFIRRHGSHMHTEGEGQVSEQYAVTPAMADELAGVLSQLARAMPETLWGPGDKHSPVDIALMRFEEALLRSGTGERRIATAVMALESLLLSGGGELRYHLSLYCAVILGSLGHEARKVKAIIECAYDIRSMYVHGAAPSAAQHKRAGTLSGSMLEFGRSVLDYARTVLCVVLLSGISKHQFLILVEDAMLDPSGHAALAGAVSVAKRCSAIGMLSGT